MSWRTLVPVLVTIVTVAAIGFAGPTMATDAHAAIHPTPATTSTETPTATPAKEGGGMKMRMRMVENGTVVNGNPSDLPPGCDQLRGERTITVHGGEKYAEPGESFAFDTEQLQVQPCTRVNMTFVNEDAVRHQFMVHGLPKEVYPMGMFNIEVNGPGRVTGTFITPAGNQTLHTHCSLPQHEQKGMHIELVIGTGSSGHDHGGSGDDHADVHTGHSPTGGAGGFGVDGPGFGPVIAAIGVVLAAILIRKRI